VGLHVIGVYVLLDDGLHSPTRPNQCTVVVLVVDLLFGGRWAPFMAFQRMGPRRAQAITATRCSLFMAWTLVNSVLVALRVFAAASGLLRVWRRFVAAPVERGR
jgi:hypothetical protein